MSDNADLTLSDICYNIYSQKDQYAVYDFIRKDHPEIEWHNCRPCEDKTPTDPEDNACLVCGSPKNIYPGTTEIFHGIFLDSSDEPAIYFTDSDGEIVTWNYDEIREDPSAWVASLMALKDAMTKGVSSLRKG